jgi:hypothetical protein
MEPIKSTYEIRLLKHLNRSVDEKWIRWAVDMMIAGFESEYIIELAGISIPYNQFELKSLTDKVFHDLSIDLNNREQIIKDYVCFVGQDVIDNKRDLYKTLREIKDVCVERDYLDLIHDFYLLYFAKEDLIYDVNQWYWNGANRDNIDQICIDYFKKWIIEYSIKD